MLWKKALSATAAEPIEWNIDNAVFTGSPTNWLDLSSLPSSNISGLFFKPDGTKVYIIGYNDDEIHEYNLSTAWLVNTATYLQSFSVTTQETVPQDLFFKPDGLKMYIVGSGGDEVNEYNLSTAWNISTASFVQNFSVSAKDTDPNGIFFKSDGLKMYIVGGSSASVHEYNLSTAWNISTASFLQSFSVSTQATIPQSIFFRDNGLQMYVLGWTDSGIHEYTLSTAWNISTASFSRSFSTSKTINAGAGLFFKDDGLKMYAADRTSQSIKEYSLSTAWNISTASFSYPTTDYFSVTTQELAPNGLFFKPDGLKMYVIGSTGDDVNEYNLSTAWEISTATFVQAFSISTQETIPRGIFFKPDGLKMYVIGTVGDDVNEYTLSTAWNVSTATFVQVFSVATQETTPNEIFFRDNGLQMYVIGSAADNVNEYSLSTAWNISTASFTQSFSVASQTTFPDGGLFFKDDGLKMYISDTSNKIYQYNLSTAWNVSTAVYKKTIKIAYTSINTRSIFFKPDGAKIFTVDGVGNAVWSFDLI